MKRNIFFLLFIIIFLVSCNQQNYIIKIDENSYDDVSSLYLPTPIMNNSIFLGFEVVGNEVDQVAIYKKNYGYNGIELIDGNNIIYPEIAYDLLKNHSKNFKLKLKAIYKDLSVDELFTFEMLESGYYGISKQVSDKYPREITIPESYQGIGVKEVFNFGFYGTQELVYVHFPKSINYLGKSSFGNTNIYKYKYSGYAEDSAFSNTLISGQGYKEYEFEIIEGKFLKKVKINDTEFELEIDLNGGKIIKEELDLVLSRPIIENEIFDSFENEEGYIMNINDKDMYKVFTLRDYYRNILGVEYKVNTRIVTDEIYEFRYLEETDSYALYLLNNDLVLSKLVLPDTYKDKKITEIRDFNNRFVSEVVVGKYVEAINGLFCTPNLKKLILPSGLKSIIPYAFCGTALTEISIPSSLEKIEAGVFAYTFINEFTIPSTLKTIDGSSFARCIDILYSSDNPKFIVSNDQKKVYLNNINSLILYSYSNEPQIVDLYEINEIGSGTFSYTILKDVVNIQDLSYINDYAFYKARLNNIFEIEKIEYVSKTAFLDVR